MVRPRPRRSICQRWRSRFPGRTVARSGRSTPRRGPCPTGSSHGMHIPHPAGRTLRRRRLRQGRCGTRQVAGRRDCIGGFRPGSSSEKRRVELFSFCGSDPWRGPTGTPVRCDRGGTHRVEAVPSGSRRGTRWVARGGIVKSARCRAPLGSQLARSNRSFPGTRSRSLPSLSGTQGSLDENNRRWRAGARGLAERLASVSPSTDVTHLEGVGRSARSLARWQVSRASGVPVASHGLGAPSRQTNRQRQRGRRR